jgi:hypothetical protein
MRTTVHGVYQLRQALADFAGGRRIRLVDDTGQVVRNQAGREVLATDVALRNTFPRAGDGPAPVPAPTTPAEILGNALGVLGGAIQTVENAVKQVEAVRSDDGTPTIDSLGADRADCDACQAVLFDVLQKLPIWKQRGVQRHGPGHDAHDLDETLGEDDLDDRGDDDFDEDDRDLDTDDRVTPMSSI